MVVDHTSPRSTPMMGQSRTLDDPYCPCEEEKEKKFYNKNMYLANVEALLYLFTYTHLDISFVTSVLARHNHRPKARHWNEIKHIFRYLKCTKNLKLTSVFSMISGVPSLR